MNRELCGCGFLLGLGYGGRSGKRVLECFQTPEKFFDASRQPMAFLPAFQRRVFALKPRNLEAAQKIADVCREKEIHLLCPGGQTYPNCLWEISTRRYCSIARRAAGFGGNLVPGGGWYQKGHGGWGKVRFELSYQLAKAGLSLSAAERRERMAALEGALQAGRTVTVLGCGVDSGLSS